MEHSAHDAANKPARQPTKLKPGEHGANICGCVKSALDYCAVIGVRSQTEVDSIIDLAVGGYLRWIRRLDDVPESAIQPNTAEETAEFRLAREMGAWFKSIGGTTDEFVQLKRHSDLQSIPWYEIVRDAKRDADQTGELANPASILDRVRPAVADDRDDPAYSMSGSEAREAYYAIAKANEWPDFATATPECSTVWSKWLPQVNGSPRRVLDAARQLSEEDWRHIYRGAWRVQNAGDSEPTAFTTWKAKRQTSTTKMHPTAKTGAS